MKKTALVAIALAGLIPAVSANASEALARSNGCLNCHAVQSGGRRMPASAFQVYAERYRGDAAAAERLTAVLVNANGHPPVRGTADHTRAIVAWLLTL